MREYGSPAPIQEQLKDYINRLIEHRNKLADRLGSAETVEEKDKIRKKIEKIDNQKDTGISLIDEPLAEDQLKFYIEQYPIET